MIWVKFVPILLLLTASLEASYDHDECQYNSDCKNGTHACCHLRYDQTSVCRKTCDGESCDISLDCGTDQFWDQNMFCCQDHICRDSSKLCPEDDSTPGWITAIEVIAVLCAVLGIGGTIFCIYLRYRRHSSLRNDFLVKETVEGSTYGAAWWLQLIQIFWTRKLTDTKELFLVYISNGKARHGEDNTAVSQSGTVSLFSFKTITIITLFYFLTYLQGYSN